MLFTVLCVWHVCARILRYVALKIGMPFSNPYKAASTLIYKNLIFLILKNSHDAHMGCTVTLLGQ